MAEKIGQGIVRNANEIGLREVAQRLIVRAAGSSPQPPCGIRFRLVARLANRKRSAGARASLVSNYRRGPVGIDSLLNLRTSQYRQRHGPEPRTLGVRRQSVAVRGPSGARVWGGRRRPFGLLIDRSSKAVSRSGLPPHSKRLSGRHPVAIAYSRVPAR